MEICNFADDIEKKIVADRGENLRDLCEKVRRSDDRLDRLLMTSGHKQNRGKQVLVACLVGKGARHGRSELQGPNNGGFECQVTESARYLGPWLHAKQQRGVDMAVRLAAMRTSFYSLGSFWSHSLPWKWKRSMLICKVQNAGLSAIEAFCFSATDYDRLDKAMARYCRIAMRGKATDYDGHGGTRTWTNSAVLKFFRITPMAIEARVRRLKWWQTMVKTKGGGGAEQLLAAVLGRARFEDGDMAPLDADGRISTCAPPLAIQFEQDLASPAESEIGENFMGALDGDIKKLFTDQDTIDEFGAMDMNYLRSAAVLTAAIPPPMTHSENRAERENRDENEKDDEVVMEQGAFRCRISEDGNVCDGEFDTLKAWMNHARRHHSYRC